MIVIDYSDKRPIYEQVAERITTLILNGGFAPDEKLPSVRALAVELSINPNTIQRAYGELERNGFIYSVKGRGNFVSGDVSLREKQWERTLAALEKQLRICLEQGVPKRSVEERVDRIYKEVRE